MSEIIVPPSYDLDRAKKFRRLAQPVLPHCLKPPREDNSLNDLFADALLGIYVNNTEVKYGENSTEYHVASTLVKHTVSFLSGEHPWVIKQEYNNESIELPAWIDYGDLWGVPHAAAEILANDDNYKTLREETYAAHQKVLRDRHRRAKKSPNSAKSFQRYDMDVYIREMYAEGDLRKHIAEGLLVLFDYEHPHVSDELIRHTKLEAAKPLRSRIEAVQSSKGFLEKFGDKDREMASSGLLYLKQTIGFPKEEIYPRHINHTLAQVMKEKAWQEQNAREYVFGSVVAVLDALLRYNK